MEGLAEKVVQHLERGQAGPAAGPGYDHALAAVGQPLGAPAGEDRCHAAARVHSSGSAAAGRAAKLSSGLTSTATSSV